MPDEASLIARLYRIIPSRVGVRPVAGVSLGIGDDAAVVRPRRGCEWVLSTDSFVEGAHFLAALHPPHAVGYKALARAVSDLAAMGAAPCFFLLTLALPADRTGRWLDAFARGMARAARRFSIRLIGGDVARHTHVVAAITVIGEARRGQMLARSGAAPGDAIYVSGRLGAAEAGLELLRHKGRHVLAYAARSYSLRRHLYPDPRLALGAWLSAKRLASAAMDLSDGLSTDLARLCTASGVGAIVHAASLPVVPAGLPGSRRAPAHRESLANFRRALDGGEDYELLFTVPRARVPRIPRRFRGVPLTRVGKIVSSRGLTLLDSAGNRQPLRPHGWDHFSRE